MVIFALEASTVRPTEVGQASNRMITFHGAWIGVRTCVLFLLALCAWWRSVGSSILPFFVSFRQ